MIIIVLRLTLLEWYILIDETEEKFGKEGEIIIFLLYYGGAHHIDKKLIQWARALWERKQLFFVDRAPQILNTERENGKTRYAAVNAGEEKTASAATRFCRLGDVRRYQCQQKCCSACKPWTLPVLPKGLLAQGGEFGIVIVAVIAVVVEILYVHTSIESASEHCLVWQLRQNTIFDQRAYRSPPTARVRSRCSCTQTPRKWALMCRWCIR